MAIASQYQNYSQPSYGQGQGQFNPVSSLPAPGQGSKGFFGGLNEFLFGKPESYNLFNKFGPQGQDALSRLLSSGQNNMDNPYEGFEGLREETMNDFFQNILPRLTQQFSGSNNGAASSPSLHSALASGGAGLSALLNAQKSRYGMANKQFGLQQQQLGLTPQFDIQRRERSPGLIQNNINGLSDNAGTAAKFLPFLL